MSVEEIRKEVEGLGVEEISGKYSKSKLIELYEHLYEMEPRRCYTKMELAWHIYSFIADIRRTEDLTKMLH